MNENITKTEKYVKIAITRKNMKNFKKYEKYRSGKGGMGKTHDIAYPSSTGWSC